MENGYLSEMSRWLGIINVDKLPEKPENDRYLYRTPDANVWVYDSGNWLVLFNDNDFSYK